jgi:hypothetical protein
MKTFKIVEKKTYDNIYFYVYRKTIFGFWIDSYFLACGPAPNFGEGFSTYMDAESYVDEQCFEETVIKETIIKCTDK